MALAAVNPLFIAGIMRYAGKTTVRIMGHGFTGAHVGQPLRIINAPDPSYNGTNFTISAVPDANTIQFLQPTQNDIHVEMSGGAVSIG
jgi:hypothetical protein